MLPKACRRVTAAGPTQKVNIPGLFDCFGCNIVLFTLKHRFNY